MRLLFAIVATLPFLSTQLGQASPARANEIEVTFRLHCPNLPAETLVYLTGNLPALGNWKPDAVRLQYAGDQLWIHRLLLKKPYTLEYKYTLGSWSKEGADASGHPLQNLVVPVNASQVIEDRIEHWTRRQPQKPQGQITGTVKYHRQLAAEGIRSRDVIVWLPPGYDASADRYPVLYMHDGQNLVDPATSAFGVDWQVDETCTRLISEGAIEPLIVVGVYNTPDRSQEYLPGPKNSAYTRFLIEQLKPLIDAEYHTRPSRDHTYVGGSSAGGLCAFMLVWEHSDVFSKALCMSPAFQAEKTDGTSATDYVATVSSSQRPSEPVYFYLDNGGIGLEQRLQPGIDQMLEALQAQGFRPDQDYHWMHAPQARHAESAWAKRFPQALKLLLGGD
ncbi:MAG: hypothetical protein KDA57_02310 [Planctomycetales bacterium]|nr:hypothetical protein [Planctomycetales bacterium]